MIFLENLGVTILKKIIKVLKFTEKSRKFRKTGKTFCKILVFSIVMPLYSGKISKKFKIFKSKFLKI